MVPEPVDQRPAMARSSDVLPAPDGPTTRSDSPSGTWVWVVDFRLGF